MGTADNELVETLKDSKKVLVLPSVFFHIKTADHGCGGSFISRRAGGAINAASNAATAS